MTIRSSKSLYGLVAVLVAIVFLGSSAGSVQAASVSQEAQVSTLTTQVTDKKPDLPKCLIGGAGSALAGFVTGGPLGYWAGAAMGYASFYR